MHVHIREAPYSYGKPSHLVAFIVVLAPWAAWVFTVVLSYSSALIPGNELPSSIARKAPPAVEMKLNLCASCM
jgi:hypothetical protein